MRQHGDSSVWAILVCFTAYSELALNLRKKMPESYRYIVMDLNNEVMKRFIDEAKDAQVNVDQLRRLHARDCGYGGFPGSDAAGSPW